MNTLDTLNKKVKGKFLYSAVSNPQVCSKRFTCYYPDRPVQSDTMWTSLGSIQPYAIIYARRLLAHISTTVYSQVLIYTAAWTKARQIWGQRNCLSFETAVCGIEPPSPRLAVLCSIPRDHRSPRSLIMIHNWTCNVYVVETTISIHRCSWDGAGRYTGIPRNVVPIFKLGRLLALLSWVKHHNWQSQ